MKPSERIKELARQDTHGLDINHPYYANALIIGIFKYLDEQWAQGRIPSILCKHPKEEVCGLCMKISF